MPCITPCACTHHNTVLLSLKTLSLIKWRDQQGRKRNFKLVDKISTRWRHLGRLVGLEENRLDVLEIKYRGDAVVCWSKVMQHWLDSGGNEDYPATWEGLCSLLEDVECAKIAKELKIVLSRAISPSPPTSATTTVAGIVVLRSKHLTLPMPPTRMLPSFVSLAENYHITTLKY